MSDIKTLIKMKDKAFKRFLRAQRKSAKDPDNEELRAIAAAERAAYNGIVHLLNNAQNLEYLKEHIKKE